MTKQFANQLAIKGVKIELNIKLIYIIIIYLFIKRTDSPLLTLNEEQWITEADHVVDIKPNQ